MSELQKLTPSKLCPIGLECIILEEGSAQKLQDEGYCSNFSYCCSMACPWPLPYQIWEIDYYYDKGALVVSMPEFTDWERVPNNEWDIIAADEHDNWASYLRREMREAGWDNPVELPYYWDEIEKCLMVTSVHTLDPVEEGFAPPVSLDNWRANWKSIRSQLSEKPWQPERDERGFYLANGVPGLAWRWQEQEDEED